MSEPTALDETRGTLPPLRIHHFLVWMAIFSGVMAVDTSLWTMQFINTWGVLVWIFKLLALATSLTVLLFGRSWRRERLPFPSQPGHWIAFYVVWRGLIGLLQALFMMVLPARTSVHMLAGVGAGVPYHVVMLGICMAAYRREQIRYWRWGWVAIAAHSVLTIASFLFYALVLLYRFLYSLFWVNRAMNWHWPINFAASFANYYPLIVYYIVLAIVLFAVASDVRHSLRRHWSHFAVICTLFIQLSLFIVHSH